jgi:hypothetical protein
VLQALPAQLHEPPSAGKSAMTKIETTLVTISGRDDESVARPETRVDAEHHWIVNWVWLAESHFYKDMDFEMKGHYIIEVLNPQYNASVVTPDLYPRPGQAAPSESFVQVEAIRILSPPLVELLRNPKGIVLNEPIPASETLTFHPPFSALMGLRKHMSRALEELERRCVDDYSLATITGEPDASFDGQDDNAESKTADETALEHLRCYMKVVEKVEQIYPAYLNPERDNSTYTCSFDYLGYMFTPGMLIHWPSAGSILSVPYPLYQPVWRIYYAGYTTGMRSRHSMAYHSYPREAKFVIKCYYIDYDGSSYGAVEGQVTIDYFGDYPAVTSLPAYPFLGTPGAAERLSELKEQGKLFSSFVKKPYLYYDGWTIPEELQEVSTDMEEEKKKYERNISEAKDKTPSSPEHVQGPVILDFADAFGRHPRWKTVFRAPEVVYPKSTDGLPIELADGSVVHPKGDMHLGLLGDVLWAKAFASEDLSLKLSETNDLKEVPDEDLGKQYPWVSRGKILTSCKNFKSCYLVGSSRTPSETEGICSSTFCLSGTWSSRQTFSAT